MYKIYVDTSKREVKKITLFKEDTPVEEIENNGDLVTSIDNMLRKHNITLGQISEFVPNLGPGSFTGLKNGVAVCNVLNWALGLKNLADLKTPEYGSEPNIQLPGK